MANTNVRTKYRKGSIRTIEKILQNGDGKRTAIITLNERNQAAVFSFDPDIYETLIEHPEFKVRYISVIDSGGKQWAISLQEYRENPDCRIIGVSGVIPIGCLSIGAGRISDSHAEIVEI